MVSATPISVPELVEGSSLPAVPELVEGSTLQQADGSVGARGPAVAARDLHAQAVAASVTDPEIPVLTIADLGILRDVTVIGDRVTVTITPTYSGCPAVDAIRDDLILALSAAGFAEVDVRVTLAPAWTTDWMSEEGKRKLEAFGIAPPTGRAALRAGVQGAVRSPIPVRLSIRCPQCGSLDTREVSHFGSTSCKALYECRACLEPFDHFKAH